MHMSVERTGTMAANSLQWVCERLLGPIFSFSCKEGS